MDYVQSRKNERQGIREYIHKFHLGLQPFYFKKFFEKEILEMETEEWLKANPDGAYLRTHDLKHGMNE